LKETGMFIDKGTSFAAAGKADRVVPRTRVLMKALLVSAGGKTSVRIRDLSPTGAHVTPVEPLQPGSDVLFCKGSASVPAKIAWVRANSAGLTFYRELSEAEGDVILGACKRGTGATSPAEADDEEGDK
jgi:hypothetical protein